MRIAFVTGGGSGLGRSIAHRLATDGFAVVIADIDEASGEVVAKEIVGEGGTATSVRCDVSDLGSVRAAVKAADDEFGGVDLLVNNAGFDEPEFFLRTDPELWDRMIAVNLKGVLNCTYAAAKGGVIAFTKAMARELARDKITVNAVCPGPAETPMTENIRSSAFGEKLMSRMAEVTPMRRLAYPEDVAGLVSYFARDEANFLTAQVVSVSGGLTIPG
jgi:2-hydroxycyclohexanecarboxyl-CoA dehydrogenase